MTKENKQLFTRRSFITASLKIGLSSILVGRLYYLQVWQADHYKTLADGNRIRLIYNSPKRAYIWDRHGEPLAYNQKSFRVVMYRDDFKEIKQHKDKVSQIVSIDPEDLDEILQKVKKYPHSIPITIRDNLTWDEVARIEVNAHSLQGLKIEEGSTRHYPLNEKAAAFLGYVASPSQEQAEGNLIYKLPGVKIGKGGVEKIYDKVLFGEPGYSEVEVNARGKIVRKLQDQPSSLGQDVSLTIVSKLQENFYDRLSAENSASAVLIKIDSGEILAMVSNPCYDPHAFTNGVKKQQWNEWLESPYHPLLNKAIQAEYSPGSIFKSVVALAALENNVITPTDQVFCPGHYELGNHKYHCWTKYGHGNVNVSTALQVSCDVYFYEVARKLGIEKIAAMARKLGFGQISGLELTEERSGLVPDKEWKKNRHGKSWTTGETVLAGIGQGYLLSTPIQLAQLAANLARAGKSITPTLLLNKNQETLAKDLNIKSSHLEVVKKGLYGAVNLIGGTARKASLDDPSWCLAGKTSTTQVKRISERERKEGLKNVPWHYKDHAMFMGFAPYDNPKYAISVVIEHGGWSSQSAVPITKDLMELVYRYDKGLAL